MASESTRPAATMLAVTRVNCLLLGCALMFWGIAPPVIYRVVTGNAPSLNYFGQGSVALLIGIACIGLTLLISQGLDWALRAAFAVALILSTVAICHWMIAGPEKVTSFVLVLSGALVFTSWLTIRAVAASRPATTDHP
jgi:hypothetical protein